MSRKRKDGTVAAKTLRMPPWLAEEVEVISGATGMTQAKITGMLEALVFSAELKSELRRVVLEHLAATLLPGAQHAILAANVTLDDQRRGGFTEYQLEQAAKYGIDPADVVIPEQTTIPGTEHPPALPVGEGPDPDDIPF